MKVLASLVSIFVSLNLAADESGTLMLRGIVPPSIRTKVIQTQLSSTLSLVTFSSQINSRYVRETQKFEVEGLDQSGMESHIKLVAGNDRTIQYELLINRLKASMPVEHPIFLKISAN